MKTRVQKWGNSLALRIPKAFAEGAGLRANGTVELRLDDGGLVVQSVAPPPPTLEELLRGVTDDNVPGEWDTGAVYGGAHTAGDGAVARGLPCSIRRVRER